MNIHFAFRLQTGGVTEISINVTEINLWMQTLDEHEPFGLRVSTTREFTRRALVLYITGIVV